MELDKDVQAIVNEGISMAWQNKAFWEHIADMLDATLNKFNCTKYGVVTVKLGGVQIYIDPEYNGSPSKPWFKYTVFGDELGPYRDWFPDTESECAEMIKTDLGSSAAALNESKKNESNAPTFTFNDLPSEIEDFLYDDGNYSILPEIQEFVEEYEDKELEANEVPDLMEQVRDFALALAEKDLMDPEVYDMINNEIDRFLDENSDYFNESKAKHEFFDPEDPDCERPMSCYGGRKFKHNRFGELTYNKDQDTFFDNDGDAYDADAIDFAELELLPESKNVAEKSLQELKQDIREWTIKMLTDTIQGSEPGRYYKDVIDTVNTLHDLDNYVSLINDYEASRIADSRIEPNALDEINAWYDNAIKDKKIKIAEIISK